MSKKHFTDKFELLNVLLFLFSASCLRIVLCQPHFEPYIQTNDGKFLCHGERYTEFPSIPDATEQLECPYQFFTQFPAGTFEDKQYLTAIDVSVGRLETLNRDTFKGARSLQSFNASRCNILGDIPTETFCDHTPDIRVIDLSHNRNFVFTSAPFECLENLMELRINDTVQDCDWSTVRWIQGLPPGTVIGNRCDRLEQTPKSGRISRKTPFSFFHTILLLSFVCTLLNVIPYFDLRFFKFKSINHK